MMSGGDEDAFAFTIEVKVALKDGCLETRICKVDEALPALARRVQMAYMATIGMAISREIPFGKGKAQVKEMAE